MSQPSHAGRTRAFEVVARAPRALFLAATLLAAAPCVPAADQVLASAGIWQAVRVESPLSDPPVSCEIRSALPGANSGRREQGRVRVLLPGGRVLVDPPVMLTHAVRLLRKVVDRRAVAGADPRSDVSQTVVHVLRVDQGTLFEERVSPPVFEAWDATGAVADVPAFVAGLQAGKALYYGWTLDPASANDTFDLAGFDEVLAAARSACPG